MIFVFRAGFNTICFSYFKEKCIYLTKTLNQLRTKVNGVGGSHKIVKN